MCAQALGARFMATSASPSNRQKTKLRFQNQSAITHQACEQHGAASAMLEACERRIWRFATLTQW
jgi:hypothetical protein